MAIPPQEIDIPAMEFDAALRAGLVPPLNQEAGRLFTTSERLLQNHAHARAVTANFTSCATILTNKIGLIYWKKLCKWAGNTSKNRSFKVESSWSQCYSEAQFGLMQTWPRPSENILMYPVGVWVIQWKTQSPVLSFQSGWTLNFKGKIHR